MFAQKLVMQLREAGIVAECDHLGKSVKAQMKYANKIEAKYSIIIGDDEIAKGVARIKNMEDGLETECALVAEEIAKNIK